MLILCIVVNSVFFFFVYFMPLPRPSKTCSNNSFSNNINVSQVTSNEEISKFYLSKANTNTFDADYLNSTFDHKFVHLLSKNSELDIDFSLTSNEQYLESCEIKNLFFNNSFKNIFSSLALNIRSIENPLNFGKLEALILSMQCKPDVISICETWIRPTHSVPYNNLYGYKFVSNSCKACLGGGVAFYVKNSFQFNVINELFVMDEKIFESLFINVQVGKETTVCGTIYRSPVGHVKAHLYFRLQLTECLEKLDANRKCYIFGDFNHDLA